ncbi:MAG: DUF11 domain-containing protein, partial [Clostridia bacterium]|nr:DUF11 domain-containing protein [Clostridia bacterium]
SADKTYANVGEEITYTVVIENTGEVEAQNVTLTDLLPPETTLVANSIEIDGVAYAGTLPVTIAQLDSGASVTVTFKVTANALPAQNPIFNIARVDYEFFPFAGYPAESFSNSNAVAVYIIERSMTNVKSVDKGLAVQGDTLTYTSTITNTGSVPVANLFFTDAIPADTTFVNGSVYIDGVNYPTYNPQVGFLVANLMPQASATITFQVKIN